MRHRKGLGMRHSVDMRRALYRMKDYLKDRTAGTALPDTLTLERGETLDQGDTGTCVAHARAEWYNCKPRGYKNQITDSETIFRWYDEIIVRDEFDDNDIDPDRQLGTSTQAGCQYMVELGYAQGFVWASTLEEMSAFIRSGEGGIIIGSTWLESMFETTAENFIKVDMTSGSAGGHDWFIYGVEELRSHRVWVAQQSWGNSFADAGTMYFWDQGLEKLRARGMEAAAMVQTGVVPR